VGGESPNRAIREFTIQCQAERPHQGIENTLICGDPTARRIRPRRSMPW
jgi:hypothetical protein